MHILSKLGLSLNFNIKQISCILKGSHREFWTQSFPGPPINNLEKLMSFLHGKAERENGMPSRGQGTGGEDGFSDSLQG